MVITKKEWMSLSSVIFQNTDGKLSWHWMQINTHGNRNNNFKARKNTSSNLNHKKFEVIQRQSWILNINDTSETPNFSKEIKFLSFSNNRTFDNLCFHDLDNNRNFELKTFESFDTFDSQNIFLSGSVYLCSRLHNKIRLFLFLSDFQSYCLFVYLPIKVLCVYLYVLSLSLFSCKSKVWNAFFVAADFSRAYNKFFFSNMRLQFLLLRLRKMQNISFTYSFVGRTGHIMSLKTFGRGLNH